MAFTLDRVESKQITPSLAKHVAEMDPCPGDRDRKDSRLKMLKAEHQANRWRAVDWVFARLRDKLYRVDGKHTSYLFANEIKPRPGEMAILSTYRCDDKDDMADLYTTINSPTSSRSAKDLAKMFGIQDEDLQEIAEKRQHILQTARSGITSKLSGASPYDLAKSVVLHKDFVIWFDKLYGSLQRYRKETLTNEVNWKSIKRAPIVYSMHQTYMVDPDVAFEFWFAVATDLAMEPNHPTRILSSYLKRVILGGGGGGMGNGKAVADRKTLIVKCSHAWNAAVKGKTTTLKYFPNKDYPKLERPSSGISFIPRDIP